MIPIAALRSLIDHWNIPALSVGIVTERDSESVIIGYEKDLHTPLTSRTLFPLGSTTKQIWSHIFLEIAKENAIPIDVPFTILLPSLPWNGRSHKSPSLIDLLCHRTFFKGGGVLEQPWLSPEDRLALVTSDEYNHETLPIFNYLNINYVVAYAVCEKLLGYEKLEIMAKRLLERAGLRDVCTRPSELRANPNVAPNMGLQQGKSIFLPCEQEDYSRAAVGVAISSSDAANWLRYAMLTRHKNEVWLSPQLSVKHEGFMRTVHPFIDSLSFTPGWWYEGYRGKSMYYHGGYLAGSTAAIGFAADRSWGYYILASIQAPYKALHGAVQAIRRALYVEAYGGEPQDLVEQSVQFDAYCERVFSPLIPRLRELSMDKNPDADGMYINHRYGRVNIETSDAQLYLRFIDEAFGDKIIYCDEGGAYYLAPTNPFNALFDGSPRTEISFFQDVSGNKTLAFGGRRYFQLCGT